MPVWMRAVAKVITHVICVSRIRMGRTRRSSRTRRERARQRGLPRTIRTDDANPLATPECDALRTGDDASRWLAISNLCLHQAHGLCGASTRTCGRDREACPALRCDHWLNRRQPALMLVHLAVLPMASIRLD
mgnify:CR=1 FL=1